MLIKEIKVLIKNISSNKIRKRVTCDTNIPPFIKRITKLNTEDEIISYNNIFKSKLYNN